MFGGGGLNFNVIWYSRSFGGRSITFRWYTWGAVIRVRSNVHRQIKYDRLRRPRSFPNTILEDTTDIYMRSAQLIE